MDSRIRKYVAAILFLFLPNIAISAYLDCPCKVVKVTDSDTVYIRDQTKTLYKVRLDRALYSSVEIMARENTIGLWSVPAVPPWEFRRMN